MSPYPWPMTVASCRQPAPVALRVWQVESDVSSKELAAQLGCSRQQVSEYRRGVTRPGRAIAARLERVTDGRIPVALWDEAAS